MNNREWLYSLEPHEMSEWFDAEHVDESATVNKTGDSVTHDSREKIEAEIREIYSYSTSTLIYPASSKKTTDYIRSVSVDTVLGWLDRQAAITRAEDEGICDTCEWPSLAAQPDQEAYDRIAELQADNALLLDANAMLQRSLAETREDLERCRELLGRAVDHAHATVTLVDLDGEVDA